MVTSSLLSSMILLAQEASADPAAPAQSLPEPVRQIAYMALLGIVLLGMLMIVATMLGGHWVRRLGDRIRRPAVPPDVILPRQHDQVSPKLPSDNQGDGDTIGPDETLVS